MFVIYHRTKSLMDISRLSASKVFSPKNKRACTCTRTFALQYRTPLFVAKLHTPTLQYDREE